MDYKKIDQIPMFFVVGSPRSGTTMLQQMLDANPAVITPYEGKIIVFLKQKYFKKKNWTKEDVTAFIEDVFKDPFVVKGWGIDKNNLSEACHSVPLKDVSYGLLLKITHYCTTSFYNKEEIQLFGSKHPRYWMFIDEIKEIFPSAKFIHIIRDYRANIVSMRRWFWRKKVSILAQKWLIGNRFVEQQKQKFPKDFYTIRYEDLVDDPERYAKEMSAFLNIAYNKSMIEFYKKTQEVYKDAGAKESLGSYKKMVESLHSGIIKPINKDKVDSWKEELTPDEIALADYIVSKYAKQYNYQPLYSRKDLKFRLRSFAAKYATHFDTFLIRKYQRHPILVKNWFTYMIWGG